MQGTQAGEGGYSAAAPKFFVHFSFGHGHAEKENGSNFSPHSADSGDFFTPRVPFVRWPRPPASVRGSLRRPKKVRPSHSSTTHFSYEDGPLCTPDIFSRRGRRLRSPVASCTNMPSPFASSSLCLNLGRPPCWGAPSFSVVVLETHWQRPTRHAFEVSPVRRRALLLHHLLEVCIRPSGRLKC